MPHTARPKRDLMAEERRLANDPKEHGKRLTLMHARRAYFGDSASSATPGAQHAERPHVPRETYPVPYTVAADL